MSFRHRTHEELHSPLLHLWHPPPAGGPPSTPTTPSASTAPSPWLSGKRLAKGQVRAATCPPSLLSYAASTVYVSWSLSMCSAHVLCPASAVYAACTPCAMSMGRARVLCPPDPPMCSTLPLLPALSAFHVHMLCPCGPAHVLCPNALPMCSIHVICT